MIELLVLIRVKAGTGRQLLQLVVWDVVVVVKVDASAKAVDRIPVYRMES